jgi:hypothetical protein
MAELLSLLGAAAKFAALNKDLDHVEELIIAQASKIDERPSA